MVVFGFSKCSIMSSANSDGFNSSFLILIPFICFSFLIAVAYNTVLTRIGEGGYLCLVPYLRGNAFNFSLV